VRFAGRPDLSASCQASHRNHSVALCISAFSRTSTKRVTAFEVGSHWGKEIWEHKVLTRFIAFNAFLTGFIFSGLSRLWLSFCNQFVMDKLVGIFRKQYNNFTGQHESNFDILIQSPLF
jgi:hypothetical protein